MVLGNCVRDCFCMILVLKFWRILDRLFSFHCVLEFLSCFFRGSTGFISCVGSVIGSAFGASSSIFGNSFTGSSASIVLVISGSTSDIYILYNLSICLNIFLHGQIEKY